MKRDLYNEVTERIVTAIEAGVAPWQKSWQSNGVSGMPMNAVSNRPYSGVNVLLLWLSGMPYASTRYLTFNQAKAAGGFVRKGEHGSKVVFFKMLSVKDKATGDDKHVPLLREYTVFNVSQCDGLPESIVKGETKAPLNADARADLADAFIKSTGADFREGKGKPCYVPSRDIVLMPSFADFRSAPAFYGTAFHELVHWTGGKKRLDRNLSGRFGAESYAMEELVAELGAAFINAEFGFEQETDNAAYLASWLRVLKSDNRAIFTAASAATKAVEFMRSKAIADQEGEEEMALAA